MKAIESPIWRDAVQRHWRLSLYLIGLFGWIDSVPLYGYVTASLGAARGVPVPALFDWYLLSSTTMVFSGMLIDRYPRQASRGAGWVPWGCGLLSVLLLWLPGKMWPYDFLGMGVVSSFGVAAWGRWYATTVENRWLGRVFGVTAAGVALLGRGLTTLTAHLPADTALLLTLLPLAMAWLSVARSGDWPVPVRKIYPTATPLLKRIRSAVRFGLFIGCFSVVAGLSYRFFVLTPISPFVHDSLRLMPYVIAVVAAGIIADRRGLAWIMVAGAGMLAASFLIGAWSNELIPAVIGLSLNGLAFGFLESAPWLLLATSCTQDTAGRWFGWGLNLNIVPILIGSVIATPLGHLSSTRLGLLAAVFVLLAILLLYGAVDPLSTLHRLAAKSREASAGFDIQSFFEAAYGTILTSRELEIGKLAIAGVANQDIARQMFISENTVKTHLKSIFRKTGCSNRHELYRKVAAANEP